jgi:hypothetical protein
MFVTTLLEEMQEMRGGVDTYKGPRSDSKWRNRAISKNLWWNSKNERWLYKEGQTTCV